uniref:RNA_ligase domain-containing protein n=1 Tax=Caenorhabditis tropicalis TaxID=1561998 RepID=A0A1I7UN40_9PELO
MNVLKRIQLRRFSNEKLQSVQPQLDESFLPMNFSDPNQLARYLKKKVLAHAPGRFVVIEKPYGISCVGQLQENGGVFGNSVRDERKTEKWAGTIKARTEEQIGVTISDSLKFLRKLLREPQLSFCTGLKRYLSGAIVMPCNEKDANILKDCIRRMSADVEPPFMYNALAITVGRPEKTSGTITGFSTFRNVGKHKEYIFEERKVTKRAKSGKYAVEGHMSYRVLDTKNNISLIDLSINKFARHLPRLMLSHMSAPILGDTIYWRRLANVDGVPELISAGNKGHQIYIPPILSKKIGVPSRALLTSLPMYFHVYNTVFEDVGGYEAHGLVAAAKPPRHFIKMLDTLDLLLAYQKFKNQSEKPVEDPSMPVAKTSGDVIF